MVITVGMIVLIIRKDPISILPLKIVITSAMTIIIRTRLHLQIPWMILNQSLNWNLNLSTVRIVITPMMMKYRTSSQ
jgi:hypothetical protein